MTITTTNGHTEPFEERRPMKRFARNSDELECHRLARSYPPQ